jgi:hypothetical protein
MERRPASLTSSTGFERSSLFQYSNGAHLFHILRLTPFPFDWSIRRSPRNTCSLFVAFAPHASSVAALYSPRGTSCRVPIWCVVRKDGSGPMEPPHKRRQRAITSGSIHTSATAGKRLRGGTTRQTNKWNISRFAWVISCRRMTRRTRNAKTSTSVRRLSFGSWS